MSKNSVTNIQGRIVKHVKFRKCLKWMSKISGKKKSKNVLSLNVKGRKVKDKYIIVAKKQGKTRKILR